MLKAGSLARFVWVAGARAPSLLDARAPRLAVAQGWWGEPLGQARSPGGQEVRLTWGPAHDQAAAEASELASVSVARTGDALAGVLACLAGFHEVERSAAQ